MKKKELTYGLFAFAVLVGILLLWNSGSKLIERKGGTEAMLATNGGTEKALVQKGGPIKPPRNAKEGPTPAESKPTTASPAAEPAISSPVSPESQDFQDVSTSSSSPSDATHPSKNENKPKSTTVKPPSAEPLVPVPLTSFEQLTKDGGVEVNPSIMQAFVALHDRLFEQQPTGNWSLGMQIKNRTGYLLKDVYPFLNMKLLLAADEDRYFVKSPKRDFEPLMKEIREKVYPILITADMQDHLKDIDAFKRTINKSQAAIKVVAAYYAVPARYQNYFQNKLIRVARWYQKTYGGDTCDNLVIQGISGRLTEKTESPLGEGFFIATKINACGKWMDLPKELINDDPEALFFIKNGLGRKE